jgi:hypothetical protein
MARSHGNRSRSFAAQFPERLENARENLVIYLRILETSGTSAFLPI